MGPTLVPSGRGEKFEIPLMSVASRAIKSGFIPWQVPASGDGGRGSWSVVFETGLIIQQCHGGV